MLPLVFLKCFLAQELYLPCKQLLPELILVYMFKDNFQTKDVSITRIKDLIKLILKKEMNQNSAFISLFLKQEKERRKRENLCVYCGSPDHSLKDCTKKNKNKENISMVSIPAKASNLNNSSQEHLATEFKLSFELTPKILIDSGSKLNLIDVDYCNDHNLPYHDDGQLPKIIGIGGSQSIFGITPPLNLRYKDHLCRTQFYVTDLPAYPCILGLDWLKEHNPHIDFATNTLSFVSNHCLTYCVSLPNNVPEFPEEPSAFPIIENNSRRNTTNNKSHNSTSSHNNLNLQNTSPCTSFMVITDESNCKSKSIPNNSNSLISNSFSVSRDTSKNSISKLNSSLNPISYSELKSKLPKVLMEFFDVFSESSANELPPHRQYDCQINIIANGKLHYGPIYPLTDKEIKALEKYIKENLKKGFILNPNPLPVLQYSLSLKRMVNSD